MVGDKFGKLTVVERLKNYRGKQRVWSCGCECGNSWKGTTAQLRRMRHPSCGCNKGEVLANRLRTHGLRHHKLYPTWLNMRQRCRNPKHPRYGDWGGRGIKICERWDNFEHFLEDVGERPEGKTLDRKDNDGDYCPENVRWATPLEQNTNKGRNSLGPVPN